MIETRNTNLVALLAPISFVLSLVSFILVILDAKDFSIKKIAMDGQNTVVSDSNMTVKEPQVGKQIAENEPQKTVDLQKKDQIIVKSESATKPQTIVKIEKNSDIDAIIHDLEAASLPPSIKQEPIKTEIRPAHGVKMKFKTFISKEDAVLELNKMRMKHKDLLSKFESYVAMDKGRSEPRYAIFGNIKSGSIASAKDICAKFEARGVGCEVL